MAEENGHIDGEMADTIAMLEQILEVMPGDVDALKALYNLHCKTGCSDRAFKYLGLMVDITCQNSDKETAAFIVNELPEFEDSFLSETTAILARVGPLVNESPGMDVSSELISLKKSETDISEELALAWKLYEENQLSQEEYSTVLHDLSEVSTKKLDVPVSVLHVLSDRSFNQINRVMNYMSSRSGVPCLSLNNFEIPDEVREILPSDILTHDGVLPFGLFGNDLLVGVLNPFNNVLVEKVERISGRRCHTYLVLPEEYDQCLGRLRDVAA